MDDLLQSLRADPPALLEPNANFFAETLRRLPLADATLQVLSFALDKEFLTSVYQQHRGQCYEDILTFPRLVELLTDALLVHGGSARQALLNADRQAALPTCKEAFYGKLRRLPLELSMAFLTGASRRLNELLPVSDNPLPKSLHSYHVNVIDGKKTKHVAKKLKLTRELAGQLFGAKLLVSYNPATRLIQAASAHADGEKNDAPLVPDLLDQLGKPIRPTINVADAQFCDLVQMSHYAARSHFFVLRYHPKVHFHPDPQQPARQFTDAKGRKLTEEYGWLGATTDKRRRYVRRITWHRTDHKNLSIVTNLTQRTPNHAKAVREEIPATDLIDLYLIRWRIETVFQDVTTLFGLKKLIGSTPEATAFQAVFCMIVYNAIQVVKAYIAAVQPKPLPFDDLSGTMVFTSIRKQLIALAELVPPTSLATMIDVPATVDEARAQLQRCLTGQWEPGWKKSRNKKPRRYGPKPKGSGAHTSVYRVLQRHKESQAEQDSG